MKNKFFKTGWIKIALLLIIALGLFLLFHFTSLSISSFTPGNVKNYIQRFGVFAPVVFVLIYTLRAVILVLPVGVMSLAGGLAFGKWLGTIYVLTGATLGSVLSFVIARYLGREAINKLGVMKKGRLKTFDEGVEKNGFKVILFMRLIPLFQYDAVNFGAGLSKMKLKHYFFASFIGMIPGGFINATLGSSLDNIISVQFFAALALFVLLMFVPAIYRIIKKRHVSSFQADIQERTVRNYSKSIDTKGHCPYCGTPVLPVAIITAWDKFGKFICPGCGRKIQFKGWFIMIFVLFAMFTATERLLHIMMHSNIPLWFSFTAAFLLAVLVMFIVPMFWNIKRVKK